MIIAKAKLMKLLEGQKPSVEWLRWIYDLVMELDILIRRIFQK